MARSLMLVVLALAAGVASASEAPGARLYTEPHRKGLCMEVSDSDPDIHDDGCGDKVRSIEVTQGYELRIFTDKGFCGDYRSIKGPAAFGDLHTAAWERFADRISSVELIREGEGFSKYCSPPSPDAERPAGTDKH
jgi:hypothetical protein